MCGTGDCIECPAPRVILHPSRWVSHRGCRGAILATSTIFSGVRGDWGGRMHPRRSTEWMNESWKRPSRIAVFGAKRTIFPQAEQLCAARKKIAIIRHPTDAGRTRAKGHPSAGCNTQSMARAVTRSLHLTSITPSNPMASAIMAGDENGYSTCISCRCNAMWASTVSPQTDGPLLLFEICGLCKANQQVPSCIYSRAPNQAGRCG
jgi:hypothetical protein